MYSSPLDLKEFSVLVYSSNTSCCFKEMRFFFSSPAIILLHPFFPSPRSDWPFPPPPSLSLSPPSFFAIE